MILKNPKTYDGYITSLEDLRKEIRCSRLRINEQENQLRKRLHQVPGELFYSGMDSVIPNILTGKISSFALNAGKGMINNFFVRKAATTGGLKLLSLLKPSGALRKLRSAYKAITGKRK